MSNQKLEELSMSELLSKKRRINQQTNMVVFGLIVYGSVLFYLMYNGNEQVGDFLFFIPLIGLILAVYTGRNLNRINTEIQKRD